MTTVQLWKTHYSFYTNARSSLLPKQNVVSLNQQIEKALTKQQTESAESLKKSATKEEKAVHPDTTNKQQATSDMKGKTQQATSLNGATKQKEIYPNKKNEGSAVSPQKKKEGSAVSPQNKNEELAISPQKKNEKSAVSPQETNNEASARQNKNNQPSTSPDVTDEKKQVKKSDVKPDPKGVNQEGEDQEGGDQEQNATFQKLQSKKMSSKESNNKKIGRKKKEVQKNDVTAVTKRSTKSPKIKNKILPSKEDLKEKGKMGEEKTKKIFVREKVTHHNEVKEEEEIVKSKSGHKNTTTESKNDCKDNNEEIATKNSSMVTEKTVSELKTKKTDNSNTTLQRVSDTTCITRKKSETKKHETLVEKNSVKVTEHIDKNNKKTTVKMKKTSVDNTVLKNMKQAPSRGIAKGEGTIDITVTKVGDSVDTMGNKKHSPTSVIIVKEADHNKKSGSPNFAEEKNHLQIRKVNSAPVGGMGSQVMNVDKRSTASDTATATNTILVNVVSKPRTSWLQANSSIPPTPEGPRFQQDGSRLTYTHPGVQNEMLQKLHAFRATGELCDVIMRVQGIEFRAHKIVLSSSCPYFAELFKNIKTVRIDRLILEGLTAHSVAAMLGYFYLAKLIIDSEDIEELLDAASYFKTTEVIRLCTDYLYVNINNNNCFNYYKISIKHDMQGLRAKSFRYICWNFNSIVKERPFLEISADDLVQVISSSSVKVKSEEEIYSAVWEWYRYNIEDRKFHLPKICIHIHFEIMELAFLEERVKREMYTESELCRKKVDDAVNMIKNKVQTEKLATYRQASDSVYIFHGTSNTCNVLDLKNCTTEEAPEFSLPDTMEHADHVIIKAGKYLYTISKQVVLLFDSSRLQWDVFCEGVSVDDSAVCSSKTSIFVVGGKTNGKQLWQLSLASKKWEQLPHMENDRKSPAAAVMGNTKPRIFVAGGYSVVTTCVLNTMECYQVAEKQWKTIKRTMSIPRFQASMIVKNDRVFVVGGKDMETGFSSAEFYDRGTQKWSPCDSDLSEKKIKSSLINFEGKIYCIGGQGCFSIDVLQETGKVHKWKYMGKLDQSNMQCVVYQPK